MSYPQPECAQCRDGFRHKSTHLCDHRHMPIKRLRRTSNAPRLKLPTLADGGPPVDAVRRLHNYRLLRDDACAGWRTIYEDLIRREWSRQQDLADTGNNAYMLAVSERYRYMLDECIRQLTALENHRRSPDAASTTKKAKTNGAIPR